MWSDVAESLAIWLTVGGLLLWVTIEVLTTIFSIFSFGDFVLGCLCLLIFGLVSAALIELKSNQLRERG